MPRIAKVEATRYKSLLHIDQELGPFQILTGPSGSGKSAFLDALVFLRDLLQMGAQEAVGKRARSLQELTWRMEPGGFRIAVELPIPQEEVPGTPYSRARYEVHVGTDEEEALALLAENLWLLREKKPGSRNRPTPRMALSRTPNKGRALIRSETTSWSIALAVKKDRPGLAVIPEGKRFRVSAWVRDALAKIRPLRLNPSAMKPPCHPAAPKVPREDGSNLPVLVKSLDPKELERWLEDLRPLLPELEGLEVREREEDRHLYYHFMPNPSQGSESHHLYLEVLLTRQPLHNKPQPIYNSHRRTALANKKKQKPKGKKKNAITSTYYYVGVGARLVFANKDDESSVLQILRIFAAAVRFAYNRLVEGVLRKDLWTVEGPIGQKFGLNSYYIQDVLLKAQMLLDSAKEKGIDPRKVVFGGRKLFEELKKNHNPKLREKKKKLWKERRQGLLYCRGNSRVGNPNLKLLLKDGALYLRINVGKGNHVEALVKTSHPNLGKLVQRALLNQYYNVELTLRDGKIYAQFTWQEEAPQVTHTKQNGVLGLDLNAHPYHIALALTDRHGNLKHHFTIPLNEVDRAPNRGAKETLLWMVAHEVTDFAVANGVAIATENLKRLRKSRRGDGSGRRFRGIQHRFAYASLLRKIHTLALKKGIQVIQVDPKDTSTIGMLKYSPQFSLSKDVAAAYVIGRRALGIEEKLPKNYQALLENPHFLENARAFYRERVKELKGEIEKEKNEAQKLSLTREKTKAEKALVLLSPKSSPGSRDTDGRNHHGLVNPWRVLRVGLFLPFLGSEVPRDLSPLRSVLASSPSLSKPRGRGTGGKMYLGPLYRGGPDDSCLPAVVLS